jgi:hypothetical protein
VVAPVSSRASLVVLPPPPQKDAARDRDKAPRDRARVAVGDDAGVVHCFGVRRGVVEADFRATLPDGGPVLALALGGAGPLVGGARDRLFASCGGCVRGLTRKGKEFFCLQTNLSEPLRRVVIEDSVHLYGAGECAQWGGSIAQRGARRRHARAGDGAAQEGERGARVPLPRARR